MRRHIENLKEQPEHIRHRVALGVSAGITGLIAVIWVTAHIATGTFALSTPQSAPADTGTARVEPSGLVGAVGQSFGSASQDPALTIVDGNTTSTIAPPPENQNQTDKKVLTF